MLTYNLKEKNGPLYIALYEAIKEDISRGLIKPNEKLPSKRVMAENNGVSVITVENAYSLLLSEGYIKSKSRSGFFVDDIPHEAQLQIKETESATKPSYEERNIIIDYSKSQTSPSLFPFDHWLKATKSTIKNEKENLLDTAPSEGTLILRTAIKNYLREYRGLSVDENAIIVGAGSEYLYSLLIRLLGRDKIYAIEDPGHIKEELIYKIENVAVVHLPLDKNGVTLSGLEQKGVNILHITPSHQFPTGIVMPISRRYELLSWASKKEDRYIIEDDYDSELRLSGNPIPAIKAADTTDSVIYMNTFSKTLSPSIRISYMVLPAKLALKYKKELSFYASTVSSFEQYTLSYFLSEGYMERHISHIRTTLRRKRDLFIKALKSSEMRNIIEISGEKAGEYFLLHIHSNKNEEEVIKKAEDMGIILSPLSSFYHSNKSKENIYVMNYSSLDEEKAALTVKVLSFLYLS